MSFRYVSIFSGVEATSLAFEPLGWTPVAFSEIEPFPCAVLAERWPEVPNLGDITKIDWKEQVDGPVDLVVGGSPCQSFSVAGKREGLKGASGLMFEYIRCVQELRPRWFIWENVPGALSSERGAAFRQLLGEMDELGYGLAWRVLDAQFFGVAQRRRRLFLVGCLGDPAGPAEVLFEPDCLQGNFTSSREKRKELTSRAGRSARCAGFKYSAAPAANTLGIEEEQANKLTANWHAPAIFPLAGDGDRHSVITQYGEELAGCLTARADSSACADRGQNVICMTSTQEHTAVDRDFMGCLTARMFKDVPVVFGLGEQLARPRRRKAMTPRRLTPLECERLQGFPDGHTAIPWKGKPATDCPDGPRYKAIGNSMAVPVMRWIGERLRDADMSGH